MKILFKNGFHPFHIVESSPWPILASLSLASVALNLYLWAIKVGLGLMAVVSVLSLIAVATMWWRDVVRESTFQGFHTLEVVKGLRLGVIMFILSEVMFFFAFFFAYFSLSLSPDIELGMQWPPKGINPVGFTGVPLLNTVLLLSSGVSITWCHHSIISKKGLQSKISLVITIILGTIFTGWQAFEYYEAPFTMADSVYGSLFFVMTGFHGIHVIVGSLFLLVGLIRLILGHFSPSHHLGFEASAWYWHFVDVVWLGLYLSVYWWGS
nr:cytochrome c oxidase subunit 3 [Saemundssonia lari]